MAKIIGNTTATPNPQPNWEQDNSAKADYIKNKPKILTEQEVIDLISEYGGDTQIQSDWEQTDDTQNDYIKNKPEILTETDVIGLIDEYGGDEQLQADWEQTDEAQADYIKNKPEIVSIESVAKTSTNGSIDTYTFTFTNGESFSFSVKNGVDGKDGVEGITHSWDGPVLTVTSASGTSSSNLQGPRGEKGEIGGADGLTTRQDDNGNNLLYLTYEGNIIGDGVLIPQGGGGGGGGGGGSNNNAVITVTNTTGWLSKTIAEGSDCVVSITWKSIEDEIPTGNGVLKVLVGNAVKTAYEVKQGDLTVPLSKYLVPGTNTIKVEISDVYGNNRTISYSINCVAVSISSYFDGLSAYTGPIDFSYTPVGAIDKTVHFLIDGEEVDTRLVTVSNREQSYTIPAQSHGSHTFEVYFTGKIEGDDVESNHLFYDLICYEEGDPTPIISTTFRTASVKQYSTVAIPYVVYTPELITSVVDLKDNGSTVMTLTVNRTQQMWSYKALASGTANLAIVCGDTTKEISFEVAVSQIDVSAETTNLELYLSSMGRNNKEDNPLVWSYGTVNAELTNFNLTSDGWQLDEDNNTVLRVTGDARVYIPFNIFGNDFRSTGKTIEVEFATRDVLNYDSVILSAWSGDRGIKITAQKALLKSEQSEIFTQYKENETVRVAFTVEKLAEHRILAIYINGIMSGAVQYPNNDNFAQTTPVGISIGSNDCTTDIYCIRVYKNNLTRYQILDNWIADTQNIETLIDRYDRNNIFDAYGNVTISKLPRNLPYMILNVDKYSDLPQSKGDKKTISGSYVDPMYASRSFTFDGAKIDVQGTSSQFYSRKNYKIKFEGGFVVNGVSSSTYKMRETSMPTDVFTFKADVASSEGANNVELVRLYDEICPVKTPPQLEDSRVRQGIEGYPMLMFYGTGEDLTFLGKYNFNNDKETEEVFGFEPGDECWEILQNNTDMVIWKDDNFTGSAWQLSFEARYPEKNINVTNLQAFATWLKSTDTTAVNTEEEKAARLKKFKDEFANYVNVDAMLFNYVFTETFLMVDNRAKNAFPTRYDDDGKWLILPYDMDTAMGINNEGELKFGYELEDTDLINNNNVFNGQDSVLYVNMRLAFADEIMELYHDLRIRADDRFSYEEVEKRFTEHQSVWGEAIFNEDARFKYLDPLVDEGNKTYLPMLQGSKAEQRKWWLYNRFRYLDSKYNAGDALEDYIMLRSYAVADIEVTPYADIYAAAKFDSALVRKRALRKDGTQTLENPLSGGRDAVIAIYSASQLLSVGDLSGLKPGMADFHMATKLSSLKVGDASEDYDNPNLTDLTIGNLVLLRTLDVRNCSALTQAVDISGCTNIEHVYFDGTATTGLTLPDGGILKTLHLPATVTNLTILNQRQLTDFVLPSYENITTLRLEYINNNIIDTLAILDEIKPESRVRLLGMNWQMNSADEVFELMDKLDTFYGLDENDGNLDYAVVEGTIHVPTITTDEIAVMKVRYPNITITYDTLMVNVRFRDGNTLLSEQLLPVGATITRPNDPTQPDTEDYHYVFAGWSLDGIDVVDVDVTGTVTLEYRAMYHALPYYRIKFYNGDVLVDAQKLLTGDDIVIPANPTKESDEDYVYTFVGWSLDGQNAVEVGKVGEEDRDYHALYDATDIVHVKFYNEDVLVSDLTLLDGDLIPVPEDPTKESDEDYVYVFRGWSLDGINIVDIGYVGIDDLTFYAVYEAIEIINVRFYSDNILVNELKLFEGDLIPIPETPTKQSTAQYHYHFDGWSLDGENIVEIGNVGDSDINYYAVYRSELRYYTVRFVCGSAVLQSNTIAYGEMPAYVGATPIDPSGDEGAFLGWSPEITAVTGNVDYAAQFELVPHLAYVLTNNGTAYEVQGIGTLTDTDIVIPATYRGKPVTSISYSAFKDCSSLTSIVVPDSVTSIGNYAFYGCGSLNSLTVPYVPSAEIGAYNGLASWFGNNNSNIPTSLKTVIITGDEGIGNSAFIDCRSLTKIVISGRVTKIDASTFVDCTSLAEVILPDSITSIGASAFRGCRSLTEIIIPDSVTSIGAQAFITCTSLASITIPKGVTSISDSAFGRCTSLTEVVIPDGVTNIGSAAFAQCYNLTSITIPDSVTSIAKTAFSGCSALKVVIMGAYITEIGVNAFTDTALTDVYYGGTEAEFNAINIASGNDPLLNANIHTLSEGLEYDLSSNLLYYTVSGIGTCTDTVIMIPDTYQGLGVEAIGDNAFKSKTNITSVIIPNTVTSIGDSAFETCIALKSVTIPDSVINIGDRSFYGCRSLTSVVIGDSVTSIGEYAFHGCIALTSVVLGDSVTSIGDHAFYNCESLTSVAIPDSVISIDVYAFADCDSLTSITIPDSVTNIGDRAFYNCSSLTSITIPSGVTSIGFYTFSGCTGLASIVIPKNTTTIKNSAFYNCNNLKDVYYTGTKAEWAKIKIGDTNNDYLKNATIHYNYTN